MKLVVEHSTRYHFDPPMRSVIQSLRVWPSIFAGQRIESWQVDVRGGASVSRGASFRDGAGDLLETASLRGPVDEIELKISGVVETQDLSGLLKGHVERVPPEAYLRPTRMTQPDMALQALSQDSVAGISDALGRAHALASAVTRAIVYHPGQTESDTTAAEALDLGRGVCQDQTHALIAMAHCADMPARYVTGYLHASADGSLHQASHAWAEIHVQGLGWVGFDAANSCCPNDLYIRLGSGYDAVMAAPVRGVSSGSGVENMEIDLSVLDQTQ